MISPCNTLACMLSVSSQKSLTYFTVSMFFRHPMDCRKHSYTVCTISAPACLHTELISTKAMACSLIFHVVSSQRFLFPPTLGCSFVPSVICQLQHREMKTILPVYVFSQCILHESRLCDWRLVNKDPLVSVQLITTAITVMPG